jgi:hypothetical protein
MQQTGQCPNLPFHHGDTEARRNLTACKTLLIVVCGDPRNLYAFVLKLKLGKAPEIWVHMANRATQVR